jgi:hypothetical protein
MPLLAELKNSTSIDLNESARSRDIAFVNPEGHATAASPACQKTGLLLYRGVARRLRRRILKANYTGVPVIHRSPAAGTRLHWFLAADDTGVE